MAKKIAVIGAGISGLTVGRLLNSRMQVTLFDKSRGVSGRMATRYDDRFQFDHGAQQFTVRSKSFSEFLKPYIASGLVQPWFPRVVTLRKDEAPTVRESLEPHFIAVPKMNALAKEMAEGLNVCLNAEIAFVEKRDHGWWLTPTTGNPHGPFDWVVAAVPAPQAAQILPSAFREHAHIDKVRMAGCISLMVGLETDLGLPWDAAVVEDSPIGWIAVDVSKPGREKEYSLLVQSTNEWAEEHIEDELTELRRKLLLELESLLHLDLSMAAHVKVHRWRYAETPLPAGRDYLIDINLALAACGDWCLQGRVEAAFVSGYRLARALEDLLK